MRRNAALGLKGVLGKSIDWPAGRDMGKGLRTLANKARPNSPEARVAEGVVSETVPVHVIKYSSQISDKVSVEALQTRNLALIEDEFRQEIAQALGKTESKLVACIKDVKIAEVHYASAMAIGTREAKLARIKDFNDAIDRADQARTDLIVHRQAVGFTVLNGSAVRERYPIPLKKKLREE